MKIGLKKLLKWIKSKNWTVYFGPDVEDEMIPSIKQIKINNKFSYEIQLFALLHECGHMMILNDKNYFEKYPSLIHIGSKSKKYNVDVVCEEIDAWRKGKQLAKKLNIRINQKKYYREMIKYIFSYIEYAYEMKNDR